MKKVIKSLVLIMVLFVGVATLTGCNKEEKYNKEVETHTVKTYDGTGEVSYEFVKEDKYSESVSGYTSTIKNSENYATVKVSALHDYILSASITKEEKDFYSDKYHDFKQITVGDHSGWEIYRGDSYYETVIVLSEKEENTNKVYAAHVEVQKSPIMKEDMQFDTAEFVKSADFQHLLQTLSAKLVEE